MSKGLIGKQKEYGELVTWARLRVKNHPEEVTALVASAHFMWTGNPEEVLVGRSARVIEVRLSFLSFIYRYFIQ